MTGIQTMRVGLLTPPFAGIEFVGAALSATETVSFPGGVAENDVAIAWGQAASTPSGWTEISSRSFNMRAFRKVQGSTPDTSITLTGSGCTGVMIFRGVDTTTPEDATPTNSGTNNPAAITTVTDECMIAVLYFGEAVFVSYTAAPSGYADIGSANNTVEEKGIGGGYLLVGTAGVYDPGSFNTDETEARVHTIALRPAA